MGYSFPSPTIRFEGEAGTVFEGLWIEVRQVRTGAEIQALMSNRLQIDVNAVMAPYVVGWNYVGLSEVRETIPETDTIPEREVVSLVEAELPAPADAGADILRVVDREVLGWIRGKLIESVSWKPDADDPKAPETPSESTPDGESSGTSTPPPDTASGKTRRRARSS